jgi:uncharacterized protein (TIGR02611 family)
MADERPPRPARREHRLHDAFEAFEDAAVEAELETGLREETVAEARRHVLFRAGRIVAGTVVTIAGLFLIVLPGPGLVVVAIGLALLAQDVPFARRLLDRVRARIPSDAEGNVSKPVLYGGLVVSFGAVCSSLWWAFLR